MDQNFKKIRPEVHALNNTGRHRIARIDWYDTMIGLGLALAIYVYIARAMISLRWKSWLALVHQSLKLIFSSESFIHSNPSSLAQLQVNDRGWPLPRSNTGYAQPNIGGNFTQKFAKNLVLCELLISIDIDIVNN